MKRFYRKELWQRIGKANEDHTIVEEGDHIAIWMMYWKLFCCACLLKAGLRPSNPKHILTGRTLPL